MYRDTLVSTVTGSMDFGARVSESVTHGLAVTMWQTHTSGDSGVRDAFVEGSTGSLVTARMVSGRVAIGVPLYSSVITGCPATTVEVSTSVDIGHTAVLQP